MNTFIPANFFDGQSSKHQPCTLIYDDLFKTLNISISANENLQWQLKQISFEQYGDVLELRNELNLSAFVKIENKTDADLFLNILKKNGGFSFSRKLNQMGYPYVWALAIFLMSMFVLAYIYLLPLAAEKSVYFIPHRVDKNLGDTFMKSFIASNAINTKKTQILKKFATHLKFKDNDSLDFMVVDSHEINAFAAPNGQIVVYTGLLEHLNSAEELAALIGHEVSHIDRRHSIKALSKNVAGYMFVSLLLTDVNGLISVLADNAMQLQSLSFSRDFEKEADEDSIDFLNNNHLNPQGIIQLLQKLNSLEKIKLPKLLSTHPLTQDRITSTQKSIAQKTSPAVKGRNDLNLLFKQLKSN